MNICDYAMLMPFGNYWKINQVTCCLDGLKKTKACNNPIVDTLLIAFTGVNYV